MTSETHSQSITKDVKSAIIRGFDLFNEEDLLTSLDLSFDFSLPLKALILEGSERGESKVLKKHAKDY